ncbi:MAG TPA: hypothetical protein VF095_07755 [Bacillota bacterium]
MKSLSKVRFLVSVLIPFLMFVLVTQTNAREKNEVDEFKQLARFEEDITGDGMKETIELKAISLSDTYYKDVKVVITTTEQKRWEIPYQGGYEPSLQLIDLNNDETSELFFQSATHPNGHSYKYYVHSLKDGNLTEIELPTTQGTKGTFIDGFKAELQLTPHSNPIIIDLQERSKDYIRRHFYNKKGTIIKDIPVIVHPITSFEPLFIRNNKGYSLKSYQQVSDGVHQIGMIETLWYNENNRWIILKTKWIPST